MLFPNLTSFSKKIPNSYYLLILLIVGFLLRSINLTIGFPILYMSNDEAIYHLSALNMIANKTLFTIGNYGPLGAYIQIPFLLLSFLTLTISGVVNNLSELEFLIVTHEGYFLFIPRVLSALFGTLAILATYKLARELFQDRRIALCSALLATLSFNLVHVSHLARAWSPAVFFAILAVYYAVKFSKSQSNKNLLIAVLMAAIAFGFHQFGGLVFLLVFLLSIERKLITPKYLISITPIFGVGILAVIIFNWLSLKGEFLSVLNPKNPIELIRPIYRSLDLTNFGDVFTQKGIFKFLKGLVFSDLAIVFMTVYFFIRRETKIYKKRSFLIFFIFNLALSMFVFPPLIRYFLVSFAFFPVLAGYTFFQIWTKFKNKFLLIALSFIVAFNTVYFISVIVNDGTFTMLRKWVNENVPSDKPIVATSHRSIGYVPNATASYKAREIKPGYYSRAAKLTGGQYSDNVRFIVYANQLNEKGETDSSSILKAIKYYNAEIVIHSYYRLGDRLINSQSGLDFELVAHFSPTGDKIYNESIPEALFDSSYLFPPFRLKRAGPYFDVLRVKN